MTCVWKGLLKVLNHHNIVGITDFRNEYEFSYFVIDHNKETHNVEINGVKLKEQEIKENFEHINAITKIKNGYYCSTSDPLLCLIAELYNVNISHEFHSTTIMGNKKEHNNVTILYDVNSPTTLYFTSSGGHFESDDQKNKMEKRITRRQIKKLHKAKLKAERKNKL